jgi:hypothetical protein
MGVPLGRTNQDFPLRWLRPRFPRDPADLAELSDAVREANVPVDVSGGPAYWGAALRGAEFPVLVRLGRHLDRATDANHATDLVQAEFIERLSSLGRMSVDIVGLYVERPMEEFQIDGALRALELARQEDHFRFLALIAHGPAITVQSVWQFHDAFELLVCPDDGEYAGLVRMAESRRVGVVRELSSFSVGESAHTQLVPVESAAEVRQIAVMEVSV